MFEFQGQQHLALLLEVVRFSSEEGHGEVQVLLVLIPVLETGHVQSAGKNGELYAYNTRMLFGMRIILENVKLKKLDLYQAQRERGRQPIESPLTEAWAH